MTRSVAEALWDARAASIKVPWESPLEDRTFTQLTSSLTLMTTTQDKCAMACTKVCRMAFMSLIFFLVVVCCQYCQQLPWHTVVSFEFTMCSPSHFFLRRRSLYSSAYFSCIAFARVKWRGGPLPQTVTSTEKTAVKLRHGLDWPWDLLRS